VYADVEEKLCFLHWLCHDVNICIALPTAKEGVDGEISFKIFLSLQGLSFLENVTH